MHLPQNTVIAVADGEKLSLFQNEGDAQNVKLRAMPDEDIDSSKISSGGRHHSSAANPDDSQQEEDGFGNGVANMLNSHVLAGKIKSLVIIAAPARSARCARATTSPCPRFSSANWTRT